MDPDAEAEALAALSIDDSLNDLQRLERYSVSEIALQRLFQVKGLADSLKRIALRDTIDKVVPIVVSLAEDIEPAVRHAVAEHISALALRLFEGGKEGYQAVLDKLLPAVNKLTVDATSQEVRASAEATLLKISENLSQEHLGSHVLAFVLLLAHDEEKEQNRAIATQLLGTLAPALGSELCRCYVVAELISLSDDDIFRVRKAAASNVAYVCKVVGSEYALQRLLPVYCRLADDDIWGVRKSCAENIVLMSVSLPLESRAEQLVPRLNAFLSDASRWVRNATFSILGQFLSTLRASDVTEQLLTSYVAMADPESLNGDSEMTYSCAFNFPAVLQTVGVQRWCALSQAYKSLSHDSRWKVRRCLAASIHVVSSLVGSTITEEAILPVFDAFLQDIDEVRFAAVQNLSGLLQSVSLESRRRYFATLTALQAETDNWRFRCALAEQLVSLADLYPPEDVSSHLLSIAVSVCQDNFASVRSAACTAIAPVLKRIAQSEGGEDRVAACAPRVAAMATHDTYHIRLSYVLVCAELLDVLPLPLLDECFLPALYPLARDSVPNIRLALARELTKRTEHSDALRTHAGIAEILQTLCNDPDSDVAYFAREASNRGPTAKYLGRKIDPAKGPGEFAVPQISALPSLPALPINPPPSSIGLPGTPRGPPSST